MNDVEHYRAGERLLKEVEDAIGDSNHWVFGRGWKLAGLRLQAALAHFAAAQCHAHEWTQTLLPVPED